MQVWVDYYRILQVHYHAEPEIIESAYKRLAKKYHPDLNASPQAESRMKQLNEAYAVLKNASTRRIYDLDWLRHNSTPPHSTSAPVSGLGPAAAAHALSEYFRYLMAQRYGEAYEWISTQDRSRISLQDFTTWQKAVSRIFKLQRFELKEGKQARAVTLHGTFYEESCDYTVATVEENLIMERFEKDLITKKVVLETKGWRVFSGYQSVSPLTDRFEDLIRLLEAKPVINEIMELYNHRDQLTGLLNKKGFLEAAERECWRQERYGNSFSVMRLEAYPAGIRRKQGNALFQVLLPWISRILAESFRKLDTVSRWEESVWMILMPETGLTEAIRVASKIRRILELKGRAQLKAGFDYCIAVDECSGSLENTLQELNRMTDASRGYGSAAVLSREGVWLDK